MRALLFALEFLLISSISPWAALAKEEAFASSCGYSSQETVLLAQEAACSKSVGQEWSCEVHRCLTKQEVKEMRDSFLACQNEDTDEATQKKCYDDVAKKYSGTISNGDSTAYSWMTRFAYGASIALAIFMVVGSERGANCKSRYAFQISSAAALGSEIYLYFTTQDRLKKTQEEYEKAALNTNAYDAQAEAFEALIDEQETIEDISKKRRLLYIAMGGAYALTAAIAALELATTSTVFNTCQKPMARSKGTPVPQIKDPGSSFNRQLNPNIVAPSLISALFPEAQAKAQDPMGDKTSYLGLLLGGGAATALMQLGKVRNFLYTSYGILTVSGIASGLSFLMVNEADTQASEADRNKRKIRKILEQFKEDNAIFCPNGHDQLEEPRCYCYNDDGSKNTNHANSETCQSLWAAQAKSIFAKGTKYNKDGRNQVGCVTINGDYDEDCKCKKLVNRSTKQNYCLKGSNLNTELATLPANWGVNNVAKDLDALGNGTLLSGEVSGNTSQQQAANLQNTAKKFFKKAKVKDDPFSDQAMKKAVNDIATQEIRAKASNGAAASSVMPASLKSLVANSPQAKKAAAQAGISSGVKIIDAKNLKNSSNKKEEEDEYNIGGGMGGESGSVLTDFKTEGDTEYTFANQDIRTQETDLFRAISVRYQQTGLKALFGNEQAPAAHAQTPPSLNGQKIKRDIKVKDQK
jgi:hypothetical protein